MSQPINNQYNTNVTPLYNYPEQNSAVPMSMPQSVTPTQNAQTGQIYQYPTSSLYEQPKQASGVNIIINNPSGYDNGGGLMPVPYYPYPYYVAPQVVNNIPPASAPIVNNNIDAPQSEPIGSTTISAPKTEEKYDGKLKRITKIDDNHIKNIENYLRSDQKEVRKMGITQLIKLCEESTDRYNHPALIALINIALKDPNRGNRIYAMTPLTTGTLGGDENTIARLEEIRASLPNEQGETSSVLRQQEVEMANEALLNLTRETVEVPDYSAPKRKK